MVKATVMSDATTANPGEHTPKENSVTAGQTDVSFRLWGRDDFKVGIWEATPGLRKAIRHNDEICQILGGSATMPNYSACDVQSWMDGSFECDFR